MISRMSNTHRNITLFFDKRSRYHLVLLGELRYGYAGKCAESTLAEGRTMQINNSVNVGYYTQQPNKQGRKKGIEFWEAGDNFLSDQTVRNQRAADTTDYREVYREWMSHGANAVNVVKAYEESDITANTAEKTGAVSIAETEDKGEFLGLTMVPEEGASVTYGMRAMLSAQSAPDNPIVQVVSNLGGKKVIYNVEVNKVNPEHATQLEMFAWLSYTDKMGITNGGTFGSHQQLEVYGGNASSMGYYGSLSGADAFLYKKFDWYAMMEKMVQVYKEAGIEKQAEDCKALCDFFSAYTGKKEAQEETTDYEKLLQEKINEILLKIENGDTEPSYQIGAQFFTEKEWEKFMDRFDSMEEAVKELMKEEQEEKEAEKESEKEAEEAQQNLK